MNPIWPVLGFLFAAAFFFLGGPGGPFWGSIIFLITAAIWLWRNSWRFSHFRLPQLPDFKPNRPRTPQETAQAQAQLRVALKTMQDAAKDTFHNPLGYLATGAKALALSRRLDPAAQIVVEEKDQRYTYNHDNIAAQLLYYESVHYCTVNENLLKDWDEDTAPGELDRVTPNANAARKVIARAVEYQPNNVVYLNQQAKCASNNREAKKIVAKILSIDPHNIDALTLRHNL